MSKIPDSTALGERPTPRAVPNIATYDPGVVARQEEVTGQQLNKDITNYQDADARKQLAYANANLIQGQLDTVRQFNNDPDFNTFDERYTKQSGANIKAISDQITNPAAKEAFQNSAVEAYARGRSAILEKADAKKKDYNQATSLDVLQRNQKAFADAPDEATRTNVIQNTHDMIEADRDTGTWSAKEAFDLKSKWVENAATDKLATMAPAEQERLLKARMGKDQVMGPNPANEGLSDFNKASNFIIDKIEGGDKFIANDAGKGPTKFGINQTANPDLDIKNLTKEQAAQVYKQRYWDAIDADKLPANMKFAAFDTAVNFGPQTAKQMLDIAGNDVNKLMDLRRAEHSRIAQSAPDKQQYNEAWQARDNTVAQAVGANAQPGLQKTNTFVDYIPDDKLPLYLDRAQAAQSREIRLNDQQNAQAIKQTQQDLFTKFTNNPTSLTTDDVMNSNLPAFGQGSKQEFVNLIKKGDNIGNASLHQNLIADVVNGKITDPSQVLPYMQQKDGINAAQAQNIISMVSKTKDEAVKRFTEGAKSTITGANGFMKDPKGDQLYSAFLFDLDKQLDNAMKGDKHLTPTQLLDPSSPNFIGDSLISKYRRSPAEINADMATSMGQEQTASTDSSGGGVAIPGLQQAPKASSDAPKPGESPTDWILKHR